ncbi:hypothetical protein ACFSM5_11235 [Lacibacterium aquatile]|uniref:Integrase n=1 Tax=Lacibacterium aquatile TaxID=1168082 RepID=A0ABW5DS77_9PROT
MTVTLNNPRISSASFFADTTWSFRAEMDPTVPVNQTLIYWPSICAIPYANRHRNQDLEILKAWAYHTYAVKNLSVSTIRRTLFSIRAAMLVMAEQYDLPQIQLADITSSMLIDLTEPPEMPRRRSLYWAFVDFAEAAAAFDLQGAPTLRASDLQLALKGFKKSLPEKPIRKLPTKEEVAVMLRHAKEILLCDAPRLKEYLDANLGVKSKIPDDLDSFVTPLPAHGGIDSLMCAVQGAGILSLSFLVGARCQEQALLRPDCLVEKTSREGSDIACIVGRTAKTERSIKTRPVGLAEQTVQILEETFRSHRQRHGIDGLFFRGKRAATTQGISELLAKYQDLYGAQIQGVTVTALVGRHVLLGELKNLGHDGATAGSKQAFHTTESTTSRYGRDRMPEPVSFSAIPRPRRKLPPVALQLSLPFEPHNPQGGIMT